jgi:energy-coupling factor transporter ATP-binding protein EcfA2
MWAMEDNPELYKKHFPVKCLLDSDSSDDDYAFTEWEKTHCKILNPPSYLEHKIDEHSHDEIFIIRNTTALEQSFNHLTIDEKSINKKGDEVSKKKSFIKTWINLNDKIRLFDKIGVYPHPLICPPNQYNCWSKFRGDLLPEVSLEYNKELDTFKKLLRVLCNHEEVAYVYLEKWIAQAIQYPANKTTVPTIISKQGAGKGTLIKLITAILGDKKVLSTTNADTVFGRFNNQMLNAYLVNLDELSPKDVKDCEGKIKGLITEPTISIDIKGVSSVTIKSHHRFINTTNNEFGVFKTEFGDRRNFIVRASDELIGNKQFFENFNNNIIENNNVVKYIYNYLKSIPNLDVFHLANNIPKTSYSEELKEAARTDYDHWLEDFTKRYSDTGTDQFSSKFLYDDFIAFVKKDNFNNKSFGIRIINIVPNAITRGKHDRNGENKLFNWKVLKEHYKTDCLLDDDSDDDLSNASTI